jgi:YfiR/HmsC-like
MKRILMLMISVSALSFSCFSQMTKTQAMFLYNFSRLIKWPEANTQGDFIFGIVGNQDVYNDLVMITAGKKVGTQSITVKLFRDLNQITFCHVIFVANNKLEQFDDIIGRLQNKSSLIVTEKKGMLNSGSTIDFVISDNKLRYMVSEENARKNNLVLSRNLQDMALTD